MTLPRNLLSRVALIVTLGLWSPLGSLAQANEFDDELTAAVTIVEANMVALDAAGSPRERAGILKDSIEAIEILAAFSSQAVSSEAAGDELRRLALQGVTPDVLRLGLVDALLPAFDENGAIETDLEIKGVVASLSDPAYRSAGWAALARAHMKRNQSEEAERVAGRAVEDARGIERAATRNGALRAAVLGVVRPGRVPALAVRASDLMTTAGARSGLYQEIARTQLGADGKDLPRNEDLATRSREALAGKDLRSALTAAQAMDRDEKERDAQLKDLLSSALSAGNEPLGIEIAKSFDGNADQDRALRRIVDRHVEAGQPLRALEIAALMVRPKARADAEIAVADKLRGSGYRKAALDILQRIEISTGESDETQARIVDRLAAVGAFDDAARLAATVTEPEARSVAYSRLSKRLSDAGRIEEARKLIENTVRPEDRSFALSGLGRALAEAGKIDEAEALAGEVAGEEDRDRLFEAVASALAKADRETDAEAVIDRIAGPVARARALADLAGALGTGRRKEALAALDSALEGLGDRPADAERASVALRLAELGALSRADDVLAGISAPDVRQSTARAIAQLQARQGALDDARSRMGALTDPADKAEVAAAIALASQAAGGSLKELVADLRPLPYAVRVSAFRTAAEREAGKLDRHGWLAPSNGTAFELPARRTATPAEFTMGGQKVIAPIANIDPPDHVAIPDIRGYTAASLREAMPAPTGGVATIAILGFSPFSQEAFKLTTKGREAIYEVQKAQKLTWPRYIAVESGTMSFGQLMRQLPEAVELGMLATDGRNLVVRVPIVVLPGATLVMTGQEFAEYRFSATTGAFMAVAGTLYVQDTGFIGYDERLGRPAEASEKTKADFRPFITAWGGSDIQIAGSRLAMLGYDAGKAYGLTQSTGAAVQNLYRFSPASPKGAIVDNSFENLRYGYYSYEVDGVAVIGNEYRDNVVYGIDPHDRSQNLLIALNTAYGTYKKHGIIISREVNDSFIVANLSVGNHGSGIMLDRMSLRNVVYANTSADNGGDGLSFYESGCNLAVANRLTGNRRAGVKVRNSSGVALYDNTIEDNEASGTDVYASDLRNSPEGLLRNFVLDPFEPVASTILGGNRYIRNGLGINSAGATMITLDGNRFADQRNQVFSGDLRPLSSFLLQIGQRSSVAVDNICPQAEAGGTCGPGAPESAAAAAASTSATGFAVQAHANACASQDVLPQAHATLTEDSDG